MNVGLMCWHCDYLGWFFCTCGEAPERMCDCAPSACAGCGWVWSAIAAVTHEQSYVNPPPHTES